MLTMQTAEHHATAGAIETAGSLVFRPRERPPTQLHQAPSRLQRCAPSRLSTISGAAEPKPLSRPASSSLDRPNIHYLNLSITGASFSIRRQRLNGSIVFETRRPQRSPDGAHQNRAVISKSSRVHTCSRKPLLARSCYKGVILALHLLGISQNFLRRYTAPQHQFDGHYDNPKIKQ